MTNEIARTLIQIAGSHTQKDLYENSLSCLISAEMCFRKGEYEFAARRALRSLAYSVGICSPVYRDAFEFSQIGGECRLVA